MSFVPQGGQDSSMMAAYAAQLQHMQQLQQQQMFAQALPQDLYSHLQQQGSVSLNSPTMAASSSSMTSPAALPSPSFAIPGAAAVPGQLKRRRFSGAKIQPTRVKKVMQSDEEIGRMVASVPVAIGRAMEHFAEKLLLSASQAVQNSGSRTLAPQHIKMAMIANPHFSFLEPLLRDVGLPSRSGEAYQGPLVLTPGPTTESPATTPTVIQQTTFNASDLSRPMFNSPLDALANPHPDTAMGQLFATGSKPYQSGPVPIISPLNSPAEALPSPVGVVPAARTVRRSSSAQSNGEGPPPEKRGRGRPKKQKNIKCVEDDLIVEPSMATNGLLLEAAPPESLNTESNQADRMLMPPPALPVRMGGPPQ